MGYIKRKQDYMVTEEALKALLSLHGWHLDMQKRYQTAYAYAKKRTGDKTLSRYLTTERKLNELTEEEVLKRIQA